MPTLASSSLRERVLQAALRLLEGGGVEAVSSRAVSAAAEVQTPTIYRQFGDMQGLLDAVVSAGFSVYLGAKLAQARGGDPVDELRAGWTLNVEFGLAHPHLYTLMYGAPRLGAECPAALEAAALLRGLLQRVAEAGRLALSMDRAAALIHAAAVGGTLTLLSAPVRDEGLPERLLGAVLSVILTPEPSSPHGSARQQAAAHAVALVALLPELAAPFSGAEQSLLVEWLGRVIDGT